VNPRATRAIFLAALGIDLLLVFALLYLTGGAASFYYELFFPLVAVNAYFFGPRIGLVAALVAGGLYALAAWLVPPWVGWGSVINLSILVGLPALALGLVADRERRARGEVERLNAELTGTLSRLQAAQDDLGRTLGPAAARPYLDHDVLQRALIESGADAAWVGWGFVAEDPAFAEVCEKIGVTFIGPDADAMRKLGDKIGAKLIAEQAGVPVAPWSRGEVATVEDALRAADEIGYPLMLKAAAGGGGRGIRLARDEAELRAQYGAAVAEAEAAFGDPRLYVERFVAAARHVEVQVAADTHGNVVQLGERDC